MKDAIKNGLGGTFRIRPLVPNRGLFQRRSKPLQLPLKQVVRELVAGPHCLMNRLDIHLALNAKESVGGFILRRCFRRPRLLRGRVTCRLGKRGQSPTTEQAHSEARGNVRIGGMHRKPHLKFKPARLLCEQYPQAFITHLPAEATSKGKVEGSLAFQSENKPPGADTNTGGFCIWPPSLGEWVRCERVLPPLLAWRIAGIDDQACLIFIHGEIPVLLTLVALLAFLLIVILSLGGFLQVSAQREAGRNGTLLLL